MYARTHARLRIINTPPRSSSSPPSNSVDSSSPPPRVAASPPRVSTARRPTRLRRLRHLHPLPRTPSLAHRSLVPHRSFSSLTETRSPRRARTRTQRRETAPAGRTLEAPTAGMASSRDRWMRRRAHGFLRDRRRCERASTPPVRRYTPRRNTSRVEARSRRDALSHRSSFDSP